MENIIKPLLQTIVDQCRALNVEITSPLAAIVLRAMVLKTADGMQLESALKHSDLKNLVLVSVSTVCR